MPSRAQWRSHNRVEHAKRSGTLTPRPCETCGEPRTVAHHDDYDRPLEVRWLCAPHHAGQPHKNHRDDIRHQRPSIKSQARPQDIKIPECVCKQCGHKWKPRSTPVIRCPNMKCQSWRWDEDDA